MSFKRAMSLLAVLVICLSVASCGTPSSSSQSSTTPSATTAAPSTDATAATEPAGTQWPLTDQKVTFKVFTQIGGSTVEDIVTNDFTKWYEEQTNVHIDWEIVTSGAGQQIPLKIASGDLPDSFFGNLSDVQICNYAMIEKVFVPIEESVQKYAPNVMKMLDESASARQYAYMPDGHMYSLLRVVDTYNERITKRAWVYQPWLDKLNIQLPETTEDFYNMLVAFRDNDPNGNGQKDEIPFAGALMNNPTNNEPEAYILNSFVFYDNSTSHFLELDGTTVKFVANTEAYRDGLRYLNRLYREQLLANDSWTMDRNAVRALVEGGDVNQVGVVSAMYWGHFTTENGPTGRDKEFVAVPVLEGPNGVRNAYDRGMLINNGKLVVTTACKNVDLLIQWADWFFDSDAMMESGYSANYGPVGVGWDYAAQGELNGAGQQAKYKLLRAADQKQNDNWFQTEAYYESREFLDSFVNDDMWRKEAFGGSETTKKYLPYSAFDIRLPFMYAPVDNMDEYVTLKDSLTNTTTGEVNVWRNQFITGEKSLDTDWDAYVDSLNKLNLARYIEIYQEMYDNYLTVQASVK